MPESAIPEALLNVFRGRNIDELTTPERQELVNSIVATFKDERYAGYDLYERYLDGEQETYLNDRQKEYLELCGVEFAENVCETVNDALADRVRLTGVQIPESAEIEQYVNDTLWPRAGLDELQGILHTNTFGFGDGYLVIDLDPETGRPVPSWNRPQLISPIYDDEGNLVCVAKLWDTTTASPTNPDGDPIRRLNVWWPDRVEKWFNASADAAKDLWLPHLDYSDTTQTGDAQWPVWWTATGAEDGEPLGIPVFHFTHQARGRLFGRSRIRSVIPQQDALNKQALDLLAVMDTQGWKQRWASGVDGDVSLAVAIGEWVKSENHEAKFGEFAAEDPRPMLEALEGQLRRIAAFSGTPLFLLNLSGSIPSGESLKAATSPAVKRARKEFPGLGSRWAAFIRMCAQLAAVFEQGVTFTVPDDLTVDPIFDNPEDRDEFAEAQMGLVLHELGVSRRTILLGLGYDPDDEAEQRAKEDAALAVAPIEPPDEPPVPTDEPAVA